MGTSSGVDIARGSRWSGGVISVWRSINSDDIPWWNVDSLPDAPFTIVGTLSTYVSVDGRVD